MGKGIALMFKERFDDNYRQYAAACKAKQVQVGKMFVTPVHELDGRAGSSTSPPSSIGAAPPAWNGWWTACKTCVAFWFRNK
jgi:hypothetical protein